MSANSLRESTPNTYSVTFTINNPPSAQKTWGFATAAILGVSILLVPGVGVIGGAAASGLLLYGILGAVKDCQKCTHVKYNRSSETAATSAVSEGSDSESEASVAAFQQVNELDDKEMSQPELNGKERLVETTEEEKVASLTASSETAEVAAVSEVSVAAFQQVNELDDKEMSQPELNGKERQEAKEAQPMKVESETVSKEPKFPPLEFSTNNLVDVIKFIKNKNIVVLYTTTASKIFHTVSFQQQEGQECLADIRVIYLDCNRMKNLLAEGEWEWYIKDAIKDVTEVGYCKLRDKLIGQKKKEVPNSEYISLGARNVSRKKRRR